MKKESTAANANGHSWEVPPHPLGLLPSGNVYISGKGSNNGSGKLASIDSLAVSKRYSGLGEMNVLPDELVLTVLSYLDAWSLFIVAGVSKPLYAFSHHEDLWRALVLEASTAGHGWNFVSSWRWTCRRMCMHRQGPACVAVCEGNRRRESDKLFHPPQPLSDSARSVEDCEDEENGPSRPPSKTLNTEGGIKNGITGGEGRRVATLYSQSQETPSARQRIDCSGIYSDLLYQPWLCATAPIQRCWLVEKGVDRRERLSLEEFVTCYERPNRPVIITDAARSWPASTRWSREYISRESRGKTFSVGHYQMSFDSFCSYMDNLSAVDDQPLYLFDPMFCDTVPALANDFAVPEYFADDLFKLCGEGRRPNYRWLIWGPARSGSTFHVDPNSTSAWNGVVRGKKKWCLYPPSVIPPGVQPSADGADVATPVSLVEWFKDFYDTGDESESRRVECIVREGEMLFVPRGWWHCALNLEETVAVTQNFVSPQNLQHVLRFLRNKSGQVSGISDDQKKNRTSQSLYSDLVRGLRASSNPDHRACLAAFVDADEQQRKRRCLFSKGKIDTVSSSTDSTTDFEQVASTSFSFSF